MAVTSVIIRAREGDNNILEIPPSYVIYIMFNNNTVIMISSRLTVSTTDLFTLPDSRTVTRGSRRKSSLSLSLSLLPDPFLGYPEQELNHLDLDGIHTRVSRSLKLLVDQSRITCIIWYILWYMQTTKLYEINQS